MEPRLERTGWSDCLGPFFLARLARLASMRREWLSRIGNEPPELLDFALASTYADCVQLGLRSQARECCGIPDERDEDGRGIR